jgi:hypothetical protein
MGAYTVYGVNVVLVFVGQAFDTFYGFFTSNQLIETFDFAIGNFLALGTQIGDTSIDLQRVTDQMRHDSNENAYHPSTQFNQLIILLNALDNLEIFQAFSTFNKNITVVGVKLHLLG